MSGPRHAPTPHRGHTDAGKGQAAGRRKPATPARARLERRVAATAQAALDARGFVTPVEVLVGVGWLDAKHVERWRRGQVPHLERVATANLHKLSTALRALARWAGARGLNPSETVYVSWTRDRHRLRFTATGEENVERAYRTHWVSPHLREAKRARRERAVHPGGGRTPPTAPTPPVRDPGEKATETGPRRG